MQGMTVIFRDKALAFNQPHRPAYALLSLLILLLP